MKSWEWGNLFERHENIVRYFLIKCLHQYWKQLKSLFVIVNKIYRLLFRVYLNRLSWLLIVASVVFAKTSPFVSRIFGFLLSRNRMNVGSKCLDAKKPSPCLICVRIASQPIWITGGLINTLRFRTARLLSLTVAASSVVSIHCVSCLGRWRLANLIYTTNLIFSSDFCLLASYILRKNINILTGTIQLKNEDGILQAFNWATTYRFSFSMQHNWTGSWLSIIYFNWLPSINLF